MLIHEFNREGATSTLCSQASSFAWHVLTAAHWLYSWVCNEQQRSTWTDPNVRRPRWLSFHVTKVAVWSSQFFSFWKSDIYPSRGVWCAGWILRDLSFLSVAKRTVPSCEESAARRLPGESADFFCCHLIPHWSHHYSAIFLLSEQWGQRWICWSAGFSPSSDWRLLFPSNHFSVFKTNFFPLLSSLKWTYENKL